MVKREELLKECVDLEVTAKREILIHLDGDSLAGDSNQDLEFWFITSFRLALYKLKLFGKSPRCLGDSEKYNLTVFVSSRLCGSYTTLAIMKVAIDGFRIFSRNFSTNELDKPISLSIDLFECDKKECFLKLEEA